jgi:hypothetical protein
MRERFIPLRCPPQLMAMAAACPACSLHLREIGHVDWRNVGGATAIRRDHAALES